MRAWISVALVAAFARCSFEVPSPNVDAGGTPSGGAGASGGTGGAGAGEPSGAGGEGSAGGAGGDGAQGGGGSGGSGASGATGGGGSGGCEAPEAACFGLDGCFDTQTDEAHCGPDCDACLPGGECFAGVCGCPIDTDECNNPPGCYDFLNDDAHCGDCSTNCTQAQDCSEGLCCPIGWERCGTPSDGCYDVANDEAHCGDCATVCDVTETCVGGTCECPAGSHACAQLTGCFDDEDDLHCGPACAACGAGQSCVAGTCTCDAGTTDCNGTCVDLSSSALHCGGCDHACGSPGFPGAACAASLCQPTTAAGTLALGTTKTLSIDPVDGRLYSLEVSGGASNGLLHRFAADQSTGLGTAPSGLNPVFSTAHISAVGGDLALSPRFGNGPLRVGTFGSLVDATTSNGFGLVEQHAGVVYFGSGSCLRKNPSTPTDVACFASAIPVTMLPLPMDPTRALVHPISTSGTQGHVRRVNLATNAIEDTYTAFPIAQHADDDGHTIAVDASGTHVFYLGIDAGDLALYRFDVGVGLVELFELGPSGPVSLLRDGDTLFFASREGGLLRIHAAPIPALLLLTGPSASAASLLYAGPLTATDFEQDTDALYFLETGSGSVYRLRKPAP